MSATVQQLVHQAKEATALSVELLARGEKVGGLAALVLAVQLAALARCFAEPPA